MILKVTNKILNYRMTDRNYEERYEFIKQELQYFITGSTDPSWRPIQWRRDYDNLNEYDKLQIANKAQRFFNTFRKQALEAVGYSPETDVSRLGPDWYEKAGWSEWTVWMQITKCNIEVWQLCPYLEREIEGEEIYMSPRTDRYKRRCKEREIREENRRLEEEWNKNNNVKYEYQS